MFFKAPLRNSHVVRGLGTADHRVHVAHFWRSRQLANETGRVVVFFCQALRSRRALHFFRLFLMFFLKQNNKKCLFHFIEQNILFVLKYLLNYKNCVNTFFL